MKKILAIIVILAISLSISSCEKPQDYNNLISINAKEYGITHKNYPIIEGSSSTLDIAIAVNRAVYKDYTNENNPQTASKTVPSYKLLINKKVDMIIVPSPSSGILALAKNTGVTLEFFPIAAETLVFITPEENQTKNITREQLREIYINYGKKNWCKIDGPNRELIPICHNADSGSQSQMDNLILNDEKMHRDIQKNYIELNMQDMLELVAYYHTGGLESKPTKGYALGYTYLIKNGENTGVDKSIKMLPFEGINPSQESIADGSYTLADRYYAVIKKFHQKAKALEKLLIGYKVMTGRML